MEKITRIEAQARGEKVYFTGEPCKRDVVCASKKCDIPAGKDVGACK